jgi:hypothetical protein
LQVHLRDSEEAKRGQIFAMIIVLASLAAGTYTAMNGHEVAGSIMGVGGMGGIVATFVLGRKSHKHMQTKPDLNNSDGPRRKTTK